MKETCSRPHTPETSSSFLPFLFLFLLPRKIQPRRTLHATCNYTLTPKFAFSASTVLFRSLPRLRILAQSSRRNVDVAPPMRGRETRQSHRAFMSSADAVVET
jgi:hypothetical protein